MTTTANNELLIRLAEIGLSKKWHLIEAKWGKSGTSSLLAHSLTVAGLTKDIMDIIGEFNESDKRVGIILSFFHDMLKENYSSRKIVQEHGRLLDKLFSEDINKEIIGILKELDISDKEIEQVISMLPYGAMQGTEHLTILLKKKENYDNPRVRRIVHDISDPLASQKNIDNFSDLEITLKESLKEFGLVLKYHKVSIIRGVLTSILHQTMHQIYENAGFKPVLFYPEGTVYLGKGDLKEPEFSSFNTLYWDNLQKYLNDISKSRQLGYEAIGRVNVSAIKAPRFVYMNDKTLEEFWDAAKNQNVILEPNIEEYKKIDLSSQKALEKEILEEYIKERVGLYYLFLYLKAVLEHATNNWENDEAIDNLNTILDIELQNSTLNKEEFFDLLKSISHTKSKENKIETGTIIRSIFPQNLSRKEVLEVALNFCKKLSLKVRSYANQYYGLKSIDIPGQMLDEVAHPRIGNTSTIIENVWESYTNGKERGTPICILCGRKPSRDAIAGLLGKSQTFTNFLRGGSKIGVGNKLSVCDLCDIEMSIRILYTKTSDFEEYYLIPQINLSSIDAERWFDIAAKLLEGYKIFGINSISDDLRWAKIIIDDREITIFDKISNTLNRYTSRLLNDLGKKDKEALSKLIKSSIIDAIKKDYDDSYEKFAYENSLKDKNIDELIKSILSGDDETLWAIGGYLEGINTSNIKSFLAMITPNYALVSYPLTKPESEDWQAAIYLRHLFRGAILSRLFLSSVIVKELRYEPLIDVIPHGAVKIPTNLQFDRVFKNMGIVLYNGWLKIDDVDKALVKLSSLLLLAEEMKLPYGKSRKGELVTIIDDIPGRTLNRLVQISQNKNRINIKKCINLINIIFNKEVQYEANIQYKR